MLDVGPGKDDRAAQPGLPCIGHLVGFDQAVFVTDLMARHELVRVDDDFDPAVVVLDSQFEDQDAGLDRDAELHLLVEFQAAGPRDLLAVHEQDRQFPEP